MAIPDRKFAFSLILLALMCLTGIAILEIALRVTAEKRGNATFLLGKRWYGLLPIGTPDPMPSIERTPGAYRCYDGDLGWSIAPLGSDIDPHFEETEDPTIYFSNIQGYRCDKATHEKEVSEWNGLTLPNADDSHYDIVCIGDSFTHGDAVLAEETWPSLLQKRLGGQIANLGVGGYGIDQAVMRYEKRNPSCDHVVLGLISGDLERATNLIYNFIYGDSKSKPIYEFKSGSISIFNRPAIHGEALKAEYEAGIDSAFFARAEHSWDPRFLQRGFFDFSYCARTLKSIPVWREAQKRTPIYREEGERLEYCMQILKHLKDLAQDRSVKLTIVILGKGFIPSSRGENLAGRWAIFKSRLDELDISWIDTVPSIQEMFDADPATVVNVYDGVHYAPEANARVAEIIAEEFSTEL